MKTPKIIIITALTLGGLLAYSSAQEAKEKKPGEPSNVPAITNRAVLRLGTQLKLRDDQKTKISAVYEAHARQTEELRHAASLTPSQRRAKYAAIREETDKKMKEIFTPEQQANWQELQGLHDHFSPDPISGKRGDAKLRE